LIQICFKGECCVWCGYTATNGTCQYQFTLGQTFIACPATLSQTALGCPVGTTNFACACNKANPAVTLGPCFLGAIAVAAYYFLGL